nr:Chain C, Nonstructural protein 15/16 [Severe acute respiratory syndrome coronavirus 2]7TC4_D Chain D, Nonstructural protein 15/16 [Severe acute respiratory syndrome coronavirus 2]
FYPKLQSSQ